MSFSAMTIAQGQPSRNNVINPQKPPLLPLTSIARPLAMLPHWAATPPP